MNCQGCGAETTRTSARYDKGGLVSEVCPACSPETFQGEKVTDPTDRRIWNSHEVEPERYYTPDSENVVRAKDELRQDIWNEFNRDPEQERVEQKRRTRRTEPLTADEIRASEVVTREVIRPAIETAVFNRRYGHV